MITSNMIMMYYVIINDVHNFLSEGIALSQLSASILKLQVVRPALSQGQTPWAVFSGSSRTLTHPLFGFLCMKYCSFFYLVLI